MSRESDGVIDTARRVPTSITTVFLNDGKMTNTKFSPNCTDTACRVGTLSDGDGLGARDAPG